MIFYCVTFEWYFVDNGRHVKQNFRDRAEKIYQYAEPNLMIVGWMGAIGYPAYYFVWKFLFPQDYESLPMRLMCSVFYSILLVRHAFPQRFRHLLPYFFLFSVGFGLPFFFFYMLLMNGWSTIWAMSFMAASFLHILLVFDTKVIIGQSILSVAFAYALAWFNSGYTLEVWVNWAYTPIILFTYVFGNLCYFRNQNEHESKVSLAKSFGAGIAHEMRNPISAMLSSIELIRGHLPALPLGSKDDRTISPQQLRHLNEMLDDAQQIVVAGNETIDLLLTSIDENQISTNTFQKYNVYDVAEEAVSQFSYKAKPDRESVQIEGDKHCDFFGSDVLFKYVIYNLLKNAFSHRRQTDAAIVIKIIQSNNTTIIKVRDNGIGISDEQLKLIFDDFYTSGKKGNYGLGLPFCKKVLKAFSGSIKCKSKLGHWTEFRLTIPSYSSSQSISFRNQVLATKKILFITGVELHPSREVMSVLNDCSLYYGFSLEMLNAEQALVKEEYQFEYDLILIDGRMVEHSSVAWSTLESRLHFTEAKLAMFASPGVSKRLQCDKNLWIECVNQIEFQKYPTKVLSELLFEQKMIGQPDVAKEKRKIDAQIMLVDDNASVRSLTTLILEQQGFSVIQAENGKQALDLLSKNQIQLILMDAEMPVMDGIEATERVRLLGHTDLPIIGFSADASTTMIGNMLDAGMNDYVSKPVKKDILINKLIDWI